MYWKTLRAFRDDRERYCYKCARNRDDGCGREAIVLIWNDCAGENGEPVGIDFYCENFAANIGVVKASELREK